jgi:acyl carrier protein
VTSTRIAQFIASELLNDPTRRLELDTDLLTSGLVDSMGIMSLVFFIEEEFGVQIPPGDVTIEHFGTLRAIEAFIASRSP